MLHGQKTLHVPMCHYQTYSFSFYWVFFFLHYIALCQHQAQWALLCNPCTQHRGTL